MADGSEQEPTKSPGGVVQIQVGAQVVEDRGAPEPEAAQRAFVLGQLAMDRADWADAEARFAEAAELDWTQAIFTEWRDEARSRRPDAEPREEEEVVDEGTAPPPSLAMPSSRLGQETAAPDRDEELAGLADAATVRQTLADRYHLQGDKALARGELVQALVEYERALQMFPKNPRFIYSVNRVRADLGPERLAEVEALRDAQEAERREERERKEKNAERYFKRGERARRRGVFSEAVQSLEGAVRLQPGNVEYQEALADARAKLRAESTQSRSQTRDRAPAPPRPEPTQTEPEAESGLQLDFSVSPRHAVLAVLAGGLLAYSALGGDAASYPDVAAGNASADFVRLQSSGRLWSGEIREPLLALTGRSREARCKAIVAELPDARAVVLTGSDGGVAVCSSE